MNLFTNEYQDTLDFEFGFNGNINLKDKLEKTQKKKGNSCNFFSKKEEKKEDNNFEERLIK